MGTIVKHITTIRGKNHQKLLSFIEPSHSCSAVRLSRTEFHKKENLSDNEIKIEGYVKNSASSSMLESLKAITKDGLTENNKKEYSKIVFQRIASMTGAWLNPEISSFFEKKEEEITKGIMGLLGKDVDRVSFLKEVFEEIENEDFVKNLLDLEKANRQYLSEHCSFTNFLNKKDLKTLDELSKEKTDKVYYVDLTNFCKVLSLEVRVKEKIQLDEGFKINEFLVNEKGEIETK